MKFYGYKKCNTCRNAEKALTANGQSYEFIDITIQPPSFSELTQIFHDSGLEISKFLNTSGVEYRAQDFKTQVKTSSQEQILKALSENGRLLKRPICVHQNRVSVGFKEDEFLNFWAAHA
jgi:arsenate reductase